jgi:sporulation protein YlmC with PRC-barrel domain
MTDVWVYRVGVLVVPEPTDGETNGGSTDTIPDLTGYEVVTTDGEKIGKVDEATNETANSWIVVDTGFWIFGKKRMIPAGSIESIDPEKRQIRVALRKDEIKNAPDFDEVRKGESNYRDEVSNYYRNHQGASSAQGRRSGS